VRPPVQCGVFARRVVGVVHHVGVGLLHRVRMGHW
jgi:hypothetical protein